MKSIIASASSHVEECEEVLAQMEKHSPQLAIDGYQNIWILKPGAKSRGRGIEVKNNLQDILNTAGTSVVSQKDNKWVVQKYIGMFLIELESTLAPEHSGFLVRIWSSPKICSE